jgi:hypothetical protein
MEVNPRFPLGNDLDGVGNWLSGQWYIALPGVSSGIGGAGTMFRNFRTDSGVGTHRIDNYTIARQASRQWDDSEVIWHPDAATAADGEYVYRIGDMAPTAYAPGVVEDSISFNNTWGPTLLDGDDYNLGAGAVLNYTVLDATVDRTTASTTNIPPMNPVAGTNIMATNAYRASQYGTVGNDFYDDNYPDLTRNSLAEVEDAINRNLQNFTGHFFDGASNDKSAAGVPLSTFYFAHYPTKFFKAEAIRDFIPVQTVNGVKVDYFNPQEPDKGLQHWINAAVDYLLDPTRTGKAYNVEVWNNSEDYVCNTSVVTSTSPAVIEQRLCQHTIPYELSLFGIADLKATQSEQTLSFTEGQVALFPLHNDLNSTVDATFQRSFPGILYQFDVELPASGGIDLSHWMPMIRSEWTRP